MAIKKITQLTEATTLSDNDVMPVMIDTTTTPKSRKTKWSTIKSVLKTYFDTLYTGLDIHTLTGKTTPVDSDEFVITDSADSYNNKKLTWANTKATLLSSFGAMISSLTGKTTPVGADSVIIADSEAGYASKEVLLSDLYKGLGTKQMLIGNALNSVVPASSSYYIVIGSIRNVDSTGWNMELTANSIISNMRVTTSSAQPASGSLVFTVMKNNVATSITATVAAGGAAIVSTDTTHTESFTSGDFIIIKVQNNATANSATISRHALLATFV